jgi:hypothetical protein
VFVAASEVEARPELSRGRREPRFALHRWAASSASVVTAAYVAVLLVATVVGVGGAYYAATHWVVLNYNEGANAYAALSALGTGPLYPGPHDLNSNAYPPLSFLFVGVLGRLAGDMVFAGRAVSAIALLVVAVNVWRAARHVARNEGYSADTAAWISALTYLAIMGTQYHGYVAVDDPQLLAQAVMSFAMVGALRNESSWPDAMRITAVMLLAGLFKHSVIAFPAALLLTLLRFDRGYARRVAVCGVALAAIAAVVLVAVYGPPFVWNLLGKRMATWEHGVAMSRSALAGLWPIAVPVVAWAALFLRSRQSRLLLVYAALSLVIGFQFSRGAGVNYNIYFDLVIAVATLAGPAFVAGAAGMPSWSHLARRRVAPLLPSLLVTLAPTFALFQGARARLSMLRQELAPQTGWRAQERATLNDIALVRRVRGPVACEILVLCYWAGKPMTFTFFSAGQAVRTGRVPLDSLISRARSPQLAGVAVTARTAQRRSGPLAQFIAEVQSNSRAVPLTINGVLYVRSDVSGTAVVR